MPKFFVRDTPEVSYEEVKPYTSVPSPLSLPLIGHTYMLAKKHESGVPYGKEISLLHNDLTQKLGPIYKLNFLGTEILFLSDPKDIGAVYRYDQSEFPKIPMLSKVFGNYKKMSKDIWPTNKGVVGVDGPEWWATRSLMNKYTTRPGVAEYYIPGLEEIADDFVKVCTDNLLDENNETSDNFIHDLYPWGVECIFYTLLKDRLGNVTAEGIKDKSNDTNKITESLDIIITKEFSWLLYSNFWTKYPNLSPSFKRFDAAWRTFVEIAKRHYKTKEEQLANMTAVEIEMGKKHNGVLADLMLEVRGNPEMEDVPFNIFLEGTGAGHETASTMVAYFMYHLALNPDHQQIVYEEIMREIGDKPITPRNLKRLKYFRACSKESQRVNSPFLGVPREITKPIVIRGYQIPPGTVVILNQVTLNQMHTPSPAEFVPERYMRGSNHPLENSVPKFGNLSFGYGRRQCPGRRLVSTYMDVLMIKMLKEFRFEYHKPPVEAEFSKISGLIQTPLSMKLRFIKRNE